MRLRLPIPANDFGKDYHSARHGEKLEGNYDIAISGIDMGDEITSGWCDDEP